MPVQVSFCIVVLVWSTTPLAIKFSGDSFSFMTASTLRMLCAAIICVALLRLLKIDFPWNRAAIRLYLSGAMGVFGAMSLVYYSAQTLPSGIMAIIFGLSPLVSSLIAVPVLGEERLSGVQKLSLALSLTGLSLLFGDGIALPAGASLGVAAVLGAVFLFSLSNVLVKIHQIALHPLAQTAGTLCVASPAYCLLWLIIDGEIPQSVTSASLWGTAYLVLLGSVLGFVLYFHLLSQTTASRAALVTLLSPIFGLLIGVAFAGEAIGHIGLLGACVTISSLFLFQYGGYLWPRIPVSS